MKNYLIILYSFGDKRKKQINGLTFDAKSYILWANVKTLCFQTNQVSVSEWSIYFIKKLFSRFFKAAPAHFHRCLPGFEVFSSGKQRREECLKSTMAEKYTLSITMIVCQIEKWQRYIRHWSPLKFSPYLQLKLVRIRRMILLKREVT